MNYRSFASLKPSTTGTAEVSDRAKAARDRRLSGDLATRGEVAAYLSIASRSTGPILDAFDVKPNRAGRYEWARIWNALWHIPNVPREHSTMMRQTLLTVADVAELIGVSPRSILRDGDRSRSRYELPRFVQLSPRARRYHPLMIFQWQAELPLDEWMRPVQQRQRISRGLRRRDEAGLNRAKPP